WYKHLVASRTLALHFLWEPLLGHIRQDIPSPDGTAIVFEEADALAPTLPLGRELTGREPWTDGAWNRANVGRFVSSVGVVDRQHEDERWNGCWDDPLAEDGSELAPPRATYLIAVTDPRWLAHLYPGMEWSSTAYDQDEKLVVDPAWRTATVLALAKQV